MGMSPQQLALFRANSTMSDQALADAKRVDDWLHPDQADYDQIVQVKALIGSGALGFAFALLVFPIFRKPDDPNDATETPAFRKWAVKHGVPSPSKSAAAYCSNCGAAIGPSARFCHGCGSPPGKS